MTRGSATTVTGVLSKWMQAAFEDAFRESGGDFSRVRVVETGNPEFGDYQCNAAMLLGKALKRPPRDLAQAVLDNTALHESVKKTEVAGPGFINIYLKEDWLAEYVQGLGENLGVPTVGGGKTVVIDYSGPNVAKPMHIGHIRSTIIGNSLDRLYRALGYRVIADNHIGDWGTQFGIIMMGYRHFLDPAALEKEPVAELERLYVKSYEKTKTDENWLDACRAELVKLQSGDSENVALWKTFVDLSMKEFARIYDRLDVSFDLTRGESYYRDRLQGIIEKLEGMGLAEESEGATVVFLEDENLPVCIVRKSDGGFNYATSDLAAVQSRAEEFAPCKIVYVTDERQQLHFKQIFSISRKLGVDTQLKHVWFGLMRLPEGTFSTREGNVISLESLLDEAENRALAIVKKSSPDMAPDRQRDIARAVGIGAVKYADLGQNPQTMITFTWDKALALDGNSGPYLQYAYARIASVRDKYIERFPDSDIESYPIRFSEPIERLLAIRIIRFQDAVDRAAHTYRPSVMADYLYDLAQTYSTFYQNVPFLKAEEGVRESRVRLCVMVSRILRRGLYLLGVETPERI